METNGITEVHTRWVVCHGLSYHSSRPLDVEPVLVEKRLACSQLIESPDIAKTRIDEVLLVMV